LKTPRGLGTRPTGARVREALFGILANVEGARVLDLYAGSGALSIEALSRGAAYAVLVERDRQALAAIRDNLGNLGETSRARVIPLPVERALSALSDDAPFDLVLCDPPWDASARAIAALSRLAAGNSLKKDARVVVEHSQKDSLETPPSLSHVDTRTFGDTALSFFVPVTG
jgi:16S rRNA (guanine966-N2)-methyltransferase